MGNDQVFEGASFGDDTTAEAGWRLVIEFMREAPKQYQKSDMIILRDEIVVGHLCFSHFKYSCVTTTSIRLSAS